MVNQCHSMIVHYRNFHFSNCQMHTVFMPPQAVCSVAWHESVTFSPCVSHCPDVLCHCGLNTFLCHSGVAHRAEESIPYPQGRWVNSLLQGGWVRFLPTVWVSQFLTRRAGESIPCLQDRWVHYTLHCRFIKWQCTVFSCLVEFYKLNGHYFCLKLDLTWLMPCLSQWSIDHSSPIHPAVLCCCLHLSPAVPAICSQHSLSRCLFNLNWHELLSASLYFSKRGAYWDRLCRDVVGRWSLVGWLSLACTVAKRCILGL